MRVSYWVTLLGHNRQGDDVADEDVLRDGELRVSIARKVRIEVEQDLVQSDIAGQDARRDHIRRLAAGNRVHEARWSGYQPTDRILHASLYQILIAIVVHWQS